MLSLVFPARAVESGEQTTAAILPESPSVQLFRHRPFFLPERSIKVGGNAGGSADMAMSPNYFATIGPLSALMRNAIRQTSEESPPRRHSGWGFLPFWFPSPPRGSLRPNNTPRRRCLRGLLSKSFAALSFFSSREVDSGRAKTKVHVSKQQRRSNMSPQLVRIRVKKRYHRPTSGDHSPKMALRSEYLC